MRINIAANGEQNQTFHDKIINQPVHDENCKSASSWWNHKLSILLLCFPSRIKIHNTSHTVYRVHHENHQRVYFRRGNVQHAAEVQRGRDTILTTLLKLNESDLDERIYFYPEIPMYYVFNENTSAQDVQKKNLKH